MLWGPPSRGAGGLNVLPGDVMLTLEEIRGHFRRHDPVSSSLGIEVLEVGKGYSVVEMPLGGCQLDGVGKAHDGAVFVLADVAFAALSNANGLYCTNAQTAISFVRSGRIGPLRGEARVLRSGRLLSTYEVRVTDAEGNLVAVATVTGYGVGVRLPRGDA